MKVYLKILVTLIFLLITVPQVNAQEDSTFTGIVISQKENSQEDLNTEIYEVKITSPISNVNQESESQQEDTIVTASVDPNLNIEIGDKVTLNRVTTRNNFDHYYISDHLRTGDLRILFILFVLVVLYISKKSGFLSLIGMVYSFLIIFKVLLPQIYSGANPILVTLLSVALIAPVTFVLSHGFNQKTLAALSATIISLGITSIIALIFIDKTHLTGFGTEEAYFLQVVKDTINIKGLFLAGIIIGTLGILDDATVTQASIVSQLKATTKNLEHGEIFEKAMQVGHDHIASTVNTLILVYTGSSLPLFLLFLNSQKTFAEVLNNQLIAEEVVTMLVSSIGLILSIPVATLIATYFVPKDTEDSHFN